jgi:hypothetical protein
LNFTLRFAAYETEGNRKKKKGNKRNSWLNKNGKLPSFGVYSGGDLNFELLEPPTGGR